MIERADLGFANHYKVGCWIPLRLQLRGDKKDRTVVALVKVPDSDGTGTLIRSAPIRLVANQVTSTELLVRIGQLNTSVDVSLREVVGSGKEKEVAHRTFSPMKPLDKGGVLGGEPATTRIVVEIGPSALGTSSAEATETSNPAWFTQNVVAPITDLSRLPRQWLAYEGVDTVLLSTSDREAWGSLTADDPRIVALTHWVDFGGRLVLFSGRNSSDVIGAGGPLAGLVPGKFLQMVTIDDFKRLENYVDGNQPLPGGRQLQIGVPRMTEVRGDVELALGNRENSLPLIVRARQGLGEVVFVGFDLDVNPIRDWKNRSSLVKQILAYDNDALSDEEKGNYYDSPTDLSATLSQGLDRELENSGIRTPPFLLIAGLVVLYILIIGPGDYLFVKYVLKRMEATWVTFPLIVVATCLAAYWYADYLKGDDLRINQIEIVDVDCETGLTRGTLWTHLFSPKADLYHLTLDARTLAGEPALPEESAVAWLGRPGHGLGGMNAEQGMAIGSASYQWSADRSTLLGVPVEVWSTKTFVSRWRTQRSAAPASTKTPAATKTIESSLTRTHSKQIEGTLINRTGIDLEQCSLVYNGWAWALGELPAGDTATISPPSSLDSSTRPERLLTYFGLGDNHSGSNDNDYNYYALQNRLSEVPLDRLAEMMMFHEALGGRRRLYQWNRSQHFIDLTHAFDRDTAMLVGQTTLPRSELKRLHPNGEPESMRGKKDFYLVIYRFLIPVGEPVREKENHP